MNAINATYYPARTGFLGLLTLMIIDNIIIGSYVS